jgi:hypothetical protein
MRALTCAAILLIIAAVSVPFAGTAFAQAGSTGGTLGNTDKSISGDREAPREVPNARERTRRESNGSTENTPSIAGLWRYTVDCGDGNYHGVFEITPSSNGQFTGNFVSSDVQKIGTIEDGHINGKSISFTRRHPIETQHWSGRVEGAHIAGSPLSTGFHGVCQWQASR